MAQLKSGTTINGQTAWHAGNDGASSGLDADLLDGQQGTYYVDPANLSAAVPANKGGTGQTSYTTGDIIYASGSAALSKLTAVATGNALISGGTSTAPSWGKIGLTTHISGTLAVGNGGTGQTSYTTGDLLYASGSAALSKLTAVATGNVLISGGTSTAPSWGKVALTTHVSGTLPIGNGGTGVTTTPSNGQLLIGNGSGYTVASLGASNSVKVNTASGSATIDAENLEILAIMDIGL